MTQDFLIQWGIALLNGANLSYVVYLLVFKDRVRRKSTKKSLALLRANLTPSQRDEFDRSKSFTVQGSVGGTYILLHKRERNIIRMEEGLLGRVHGSTYCVVATKSVPIADQMLAIKIALENDEYEVMRVAI